MALAVNVDPNAPVNQPASAPLAGDPVKQARLRALWQRDDLTDEQRRAVEELLKQEGLPVEALPPPRSFPDRMRDAGRVLMEDYLRPLGDFAKQAALPLAGQLGGMVIGSRIGMPIGGGAVGAGLGTALSEWLSGASSDDSMTGLPTPLESGAISGVLTYGAGYLPKLLKVMPGHEAAEQMEAARRMRALEQSYRVPKPAPSEALYQQLDDLADPSISMAPFRKVLRDLNYERSILAESRTAAGKLKSTGMLGRYQAYFRDLQARDDQWKLSKLRAEIRNLNRLIGWAEEQQSPDVGELKQLYRGMMESLESAAASEAVPAQFRAQLARANALFKREIASDQLADLLRKKAIKQRHVYGMILEEVDPAAVKTALLRMADDDLIPSVLRKELPGIFSFLDELAAAPKLPGSTGTDVRLGHMGRIAATAGGASIGAYLQGPLGSAVGAAAGLSTYEALARAMMSETGRRLMARMFAAAGNQWTPALSQTIVNLASQGLFTREPSEEEGGGYVVDRDLDAYRDGR